MVYALYPAVDEDYQFPPEVREALALSPELRNTVVPLTETQRNNLAGAELWTDRLVLNTTTKRIDRYDGSDWVQITTEPAGIIKIDAGATPPDFHLVCDGSVISRAGINAALFARIGTTYNTGGETGTQFRLPNLKGKVVVGVDAAQAEFNTLGETGGEKSHVLTTGEMPAHAHPITVTVDAVGDHSHATHLADDPHSSGGLTTKSYSASPGDGTFPAGAHTHSASGSAGNTGGGAAHNVLQPYAALHYVITL